MRHKDTQLPLDVRVIKIPKWDGQRVNLDTRQIGHLPVQFAIKLFRLFTDINIGGNTIDDRDHEGEQDGKLCADGI